MNAPLDGTALRAAMRCFATGVTVITTQDGQGTPVGLTANSFSSVSLEPPLVLWSLGRRSRSLPAFLAAPHYAINVLCADQIALAARFASPVADRFEGVDWTPGAHGSPLLAGSAAWFECASVHRHEHGDHVVFIGEVLRCGHSAHPPLLFAGGAYGIPAAHPQG